MKREVTANKEEHPHTYYHHKTKSLHQSKENNGLLTREKKFLL